MFVKAIPSYLLVSALLAMGGGKESPDDPPAQVGRIAYVEGAASWRTGQNSWTSASLNIPVTSGESFWTDPGAKMVLQEGTMEIRMDQDTELAILRLDHSSTRLSLPQGDINVHLDTLASGGIQVNTPRGQIALAAPGSYHINAGHPDGEVPSQQAQVTVLEGAAQVAGPYALLDVHTGERVTLSGDPSVLKLSEGSATAFDDWALLREQRGHAFISARYVSPRLTGYQELDAHGSWTNDSHYGPVWYPAGLPSDWSPYRYGHWTDIAPWGWTWIDDASWGFAPFHYGRWVSINGRWAWCPPANRNESVYAPALVAFVGGNGWTINNQAAIGWIPLAPGEIFKPYYHASFTYIKDINIANVSQTTLINSIVGSRRHTIAYYANRNGMTILPASDFSTPSITQAMLNAPKEAISTAPVLQNMAHNLPAVVSNPALSPQPPFPVATNPAPPASFPSPATTATLTAAVYKLRKPSLPQADIPHPSQHTQLMPTPNGWKRVMPDKVAASEVSVGDAGL